jgi:hypothetical protein
LLYEVNKPSVDEENSDKLKYSCDKLLDLVKQVGFENVVGKRDRW